MILLKFKFFSRDQQPAVGSLLRMGVILVNTFTAAEYTEKNNDLMK